MSKKVVSATLAGALAVGMVPAMALADEAPELELLATTEEAWDGGVFTATDNAGKVVVSALKVSAFVPVSFTYDGTAHYLIPTVAAPAGAANAEDLTNALAYTVTYHASADGTGAAIDAATIKEPGVYSVKVVGLAGVYQGQDVVMSFKIAGKSLADAYVYEYDAQNPTVLTDTEIVYDGSDIKFSNDSIKLAMGGKELVQGTDWSGIGTYVYGSNKTPIADHAAAGKRVLAIEGLDDYAGSTANVVYEVKALDLATANLVVDSYNVTTDASFAVTAVNGKAVAGELAGANLTYTYVSDSKNQGVMGENATYTYKVAPTDPKSTNVINSATITFDKVANIADIEYDGADFGTSPKNVNLADASTAFVADKITVEDGSGNELNPNWYTVSYTDAKGNAATLADLSTPGAWKVVVKVDAAKTGYTYGGTAIQDVVVKGGDILESGIFLKYNGQVINGGATAGAAQEICDFNGADQMGNLTTTVVVTENKVQKTLVEGKDYTVAITKDGKAVTSMTDAGVYCITVKGKGYAMADYVKYVEIDAIDAVTLRLADPIKNTTNALGYAGGEQVVPAFEYNTGKVDAAGNPIWAELPASSYTLSYTYKGVDGLATPVAVKKMDKVGIYAVTIADIALDVNYVVTGQSIDVAISNARTFIDVPNNVWYTDVVYEVTQVLKYMNGYAGTDLFGPNDTMNRAQFVCVLYNMAGGTAGNDNGVDNIGGYVSSFSDVPTGAYYAQAVAWAEKAGIANGHDGKFMPNDPVTREQAAAFFCNFADYLGLDVEADADAFSKVKDSAKISKWAVDVCAWAVSEGIMGNGGYVNPQGILTRAEGAAMAYNFAPKGVAALV